MVNLYGNDPDVTMMLDSFDWYILPVFNVDGYEYTWTDVSTTVVFLFFLHSHCLKTRDEDIVIVSILSMFDTQ